MHFANHSRENLGMQLFSCINLHDFVVQLCLKEKLDKVQVDIQPLTDFHILLHKHALHDPSNVIFFFFGI